MISRCMQYLIKHNYDHENIKLREELNSNRSHLVVDISGYGFEPFEFSYHEVIASRQTLPLNLHTCCASSCLLTFQQYL